MNLGLVDVLRQFDGFLHQFDIERVVIGFFAGQVDRHQRFAAFRRGWSLPSTPGKGICAAGASRWGEDHRLQAVVLVRHFQQKIMLAGKHFLNDGFEGAVMPDHFDFDRHAVVEIETALLVDPGGALADHTLPHRRSFVRREQGRHFVREVINGQEGFDAPAVPFYRYTARRNAG